MAKVAVILSGCGYLDGAEISESVFTLFCLDQKDIEFDCYAPDINQHDVIDHNTGQKIDQTRNVMQEAARISRGNIKNLSSLSSKDYDAIFLPGGYGVAKNLSDLALVGANAKIFPKLKEILIEFLQEKKPIGAICISPAILVAALKDKASVTVTIGDDNDNLIENLGGKHNSCATDNIIYDQEHNIASCSAFMRGDARLKDVASGIEKVVNKVLEKI